MSEETIRARKLTVRLQIELLEGASARIKAMEDDADTAGISPAMRDWANGILEDMSVFDLAFICGLSSIEKFLDMTEDDIQRLAKEAKKVNPLFFEMIDRRKKQVEEFKELAPEEYAKLVRSSINKSKIPEETQVH